MLLMSTDIKIVSKILVNSSIIGNVFLYLNIVFTAVISFPEIKKKISAEKSHMGFKSMLVLTCFCVFLAKKCHQISFFGKLFN